MTSKMLNLKQPLDILKKNKRYFKIISWKNISNYTIKLPLILLVILESIMLSISDKQYQNRFRK